MIELRAPAKINLGLELLARRRDGYHEIETVFLPLRIFDLIRMELQAAPAIHLDVGGDLGGAELPVDADNLAYRSAERTLAALGQKGGVRIRLEKHIPIAAGLGGGSSDAAMVLLGLEALVGRGLEPAQRSEIALGLGADVPFFLDPRPALGRGVGEILTALPRLPEMWWLLLVFPFGVATPWAYSQASRQLTLPRDGSSIAALLGPSGVLSDPPNDLESAAAARHPEIREARRALGNAGAMITGMSGSGPTVFGRFESREAALRASKESKLPEGVTTIAASSPGSASSNWGWGVAKR